jgi:hypothetical protein
MKLAIGALMTAIGCGNSDTPSGPHPVPWHDPIRAPGNWKADNPYADNADPKLVLASDLSRQFRRDPEDPEKANEPWFWWDHTTTLFIRLNDCSEFLLTKYVQVVGARAKRVGFTELACDEQHFAISIP